MPRSRTSGAGRARSTTCAPVSPAIWKADWGLDPTRRLYGRRGLRRPGGRAAPCDASAVQAAAQEVARQRAASAHAAAAEAGQLASRVEPVQRLPLGRQHARAQVRLQTAERLAGEEVQAHR